RRALGVSADTGDLRLGRAAGGACGHQYRRRPKTESASHRAGRWRHRLCDQRDLGADRGALVRGLAWAIQSRSECHRDRQRLSTDCRPSVWILWLGDGALLRFPGSGATLVAAACRIPPRRGCDRRWLAYASPDRLNQLAVRSARLGSDRLRCHAYGGHHIRGMVWSRPTLNVTTFRAVGFTQHAQLSQLPTFDFRNYHKFLPSSCLTGMAARSKSSNNLALTATCGRLKSGPFSPQEQRTSL